MAGVSALTLIRGLGTRLQEFILLNAGDLSAGTTTTLVSQKLKQYFPQDTNQLYAWVYGAAGADALNVGVETRSTSWTFNNFTLTLFPPGFPASVTQGPYEIHVRFQRATMLEAINDAVGQLGLTWFREMMDESLTTAQNQWLYTLPASQNWSNVTQVEIQLATDAQQVAGGYPFVPADDLNPRIDRSVDLNGNELWQIQFGIQPPPGRILRVWGEAFYQDMVADTDFVPLAGKWLRPALAWIYSMASFNLTDWSNNRQPTAQLEQARQRAADILERQKNQILSMAPSHTPGKILTPGRGDGYPVEAPSDWRYLHAFKSAAFIPGGG